MDYTNRLHSWNETLLNGALHLHRLGRSTARDFWVDRANQTYYQTFRCTGSLSEFGEKAYTQFYVMRVQTVDGVHPAKATIQKKVGELLVDAVSEEGEKLEKALMAMGVVTGPRRSEEKGEGGGLQKRRCAGIWTRTSRGAIESGAL